MLSGEVGLSDYMSTLFHELFTSLCCLFLQYLLFVVGAWTETGLALARLTTLDHGISKVC